jgi:hypothetical protein
MTSPARRLKRRQGRDTTYRLKKLAMVLPNFNIVPDAPVEPEVLKRSAGDYTPLPNKRKQKRRAVRAARRASRGSVRGS